MRPSIENHLSRAGLRLALLLVAIPDASYGYIDPGSGSFLIQAALAGLLGLSFTAKSFWRSLKDRFTRNAGSQPKDS